MSFWEPAYCEPMLLRRQMNNITRQRLKSHDMLTCQATHLSAGQPACSAASGFCADQNLFLFPFFSFVFPPSVSSFLLAVPLSPSTRSGDARSFLRPAQRAFGEALRCSTPGPSSTATGLFQPRCRWPARRCRSRLRRTTTGGILVGQHSGKVCGRSANLFPRDLAVGTEGTGRTW